MKYYKPWLKKRLSVGKTATPTYAIIGSQSVKTTSKSEQKGFDGGKKIKGRKRNILVDTNIKAISADAGYRKTFSMIGNMKQNVK